MKKFIKNHLKLWIVILLCFLILLGLVEIIHFSKKKEDAKKKSSDQYIFSKRVTELPGTEVYTNEALQSSHCLNSICIINATFYYIGDEGRVDYAIVNRSSEKATGYFKMVFGDQKLIIAFRDVPPLGIVKNTAQYSGVSFSSRENYVLEELTKEEKKALVMKK